MIVSVNPVAVIVSELRAFRQGRKRIAEIRIPLLNPVRRPILRRALSSGRVFAKVKTALEKERGQKPGAKDPNMDQAGLTRDLEGCLAFHRRTRLVPRQLRLGKAARRESLTSRLRLNFLCR
jgi:hypothetical protein